MEYSKMEQRVLAFMNQTQMLRPGDAVTVALSGGADSVALLLVLHRLAGELGIRLTAAHFHHALRPVEADRDRDFVRALCARLSIPLCLGGQDVAAYAKKSGRSLEEAARVLRYDFLLQSAPGKLATAHHLDDNAETVLLHLLRGSGPRGLCGIPPVRDRIIRPFLCLTHEEIVAQLTAWGEHWVEDSTNAQDDCVRNRLRHKVIPLLQAENPSFARTLARSCGLLAREDAYLSEIAARAEASCRVSGGWSCRALCKLDEVILNRVILGLLRALALEDPSARDVAEVRRVLAAADPSARGVLSGGWQVLRRYDVLAFAPASSKAPALGRTELVIPGVTILPDDLGELHCAVTKNSKIRYKNTFTFALKYDMIAQSECIVRARQTADALLLPGGTRSLKRLMIDRRIPRDLRDRLPVLAANGKAVAVMGLAADRRYLAGAEDTALVVEYRPGPAGIPAPWGGQEGE